MTGGPNEPAAPVLVRLSRAVKWGECDPAGIMYTPRYADWAVEAIERVFAQVLGCAWHELHSARNLAAPFVQLNLTFLQPLAAEAEVELSVSLARLGETSLTYVVAARHAGEACFTATLTHVILDKATGRATPIPADWRARLDALARP